MNLCGGSLTVHSLDLIGLYQLPFALAGYVYRVTNYMAHPPGVEPGYLVLQTSAVEPSLLEMHYFVKIQRP